jgi:L-2,4-diaminobutyrate decarboxylase
MSALERLKERYGSKGFEETGHALVSALGGYLERAASVDKSLDWKDPEELIRLADGALSGRKPAELIDLFLAHTQRLHSPRYLGHQVAPPVPEAAVFDMLGQVTNQGCAVYEMGPFPVAVEKAIAARLAAKIGWREGFGAIATHGGTLANLTAILAAKNHHFPGSWENGLAAGVKPVALVGADAHYSISRAVGISGLGTKSLLSVSLDDKRRLDPLQLQSVYDAAKKRGETPFCVVATSGTTPVGAFDPIRPIADFCRKHGLWLHIDGAHGTSVLFSSQHRALVDGIELADSVTWDAHKMLYVPALCTFLLYRERNKSYTPFRQDAPYLLDEEAVRLQEYDCAHRTVECTKRSLAVSLWAAWSMYGEGHFADLVDVTFANTRRFHELLSEAPDFEPCHEPQGNILCFRYLKSKNQAELRRRLLTSGHYYITTARLDGEMVLRVTVMNPFTDDTHFRGLLDEIRMFGCASPS